MPVYETLITPYRAIVDRLVDETEGQEWEVRRAYLTSIFSALERGSQRFPDQIDPERSLGEIIAGMIERLGQPEIRGWLQAGIYAASANAEHRRAATAWFGDNPEGLDRAQQELSRGARLH